MEVTMKLVSFEVSEFKCIMDSGKVSITDIGCLVGKNESGKTALLQALYRLNPIDEQDAKFNVTQEYPRSEVTDYENRVKDGEQNPAEVIKACFLLDESDFKKMGIPSFLFDTKDVLLSRGYDSELHPTIHINEKQFIEWSLSNVEYSEDEQNANLIKEIRENQTIEGLSDIQLDEYNEVPQCANLVTWINSTKGSDPERVIFKEYLQPIIPKFLYFDEYYQMSGTVNIDKLKERVSSGRVRDSDKPMLGLIELAGLSLDSFDQIKDTRDLLNKLEGASNKIQRSFMKYWSQSHNINMVIDMRKGMPEDKEEFKSGYNIWTQIRNNVHQVTTEIDERSRGFIWFFSFMAWFSLQQKKHSGDIILLLDEPGLTLHAKAQNDLLRYIDEELSPHHQVIYTTHSPFMIDMKHTERIYIVEDKGLVEGDIIGTKVTSDVLQTGSDSLFPLQSALGYEITQSLFVGPYCLIVEGPSDLIYLTAMSSVLEKLGRTYLDQRWTITPVGGIDKVPAFVSLFSSQKTMTLAVLLDFQSKDAQLIENLYKRKLLNKSSIKTFAEFLDQDEADIEDLFDPAFYIKLVNSEYSKELSKKITASQLTSNIPRITVQLSRYFQEKPLKKGIQYNHYRPARYFNENIHELEGDIEEDTLSHFEDIFKWLNSLLC